jgi:Flp pilus assembly protein TadG
MRARRTPTHPRRGSNLVEAAIAIPVALMLIIGTCIMGLGIYRYQLVATLAREGARYASVHGTQYAAVTGNAAATAADVYDNAILPMAVGLETANLSYTVTWNAANSPTTANPNSSPPGAPVYNNVTVTVNYQWTPELYITGPLTLTSTSTMPMSF